MENWRPISIALFVVNLTFGMILVGLGMEWVDACEAGDCSIPLLPLVGLGTVAVVVNAVLGGVWLATKR